MPLPYIPYLVKHTVYARENRSRPTVTEKTVRKSMLSGRPLGYKFTRQKPLWPYIADFYCSKLLLVIEIDGSSHRGREEYDARRDAYLASLGIVTIRYSNEEVMCAADQMYEDILKQLRMRAHELGR
jgi:very-short-patch-repair endonuclease